ncbi:MAG: hypothetical protein ACTSUO_05530 [Candidatus Thorarchaeota archaeon]
MWEFGYVVDGLRFNRRRAGLLLVAPIIIAASVSSVLLVSSSAYAYGIDQIDKQVFHDFFLGFESPLTDTEMDDILIDLGQIDSLEYVEPYALITGTHDSTSYAFCYIPDNSSFWQNLDTSISESVLEQGMAIELLSEMSSPTFSVGSDFSTTHGYYKGDNYGILNLSYSIVAYRESDFLKESITNILGFSEQRMRPNPPETILICSYETSFQPILDFLGSEGIPDEHGFQSGVGAGFTESFLQSRVIEGSYWTFSSELKNNISSIAQSYGTSELFMNSDGVVLDYDALSRTITVLMLIDSIPLFVILFFISRSIVIELQDGSRKQDLLLKKKGFSKNQLKRIKLLEIVTVSLLSVPLGLLVSVLLLVYVDLSVANFYTSFQGFTPMLLLIAFLTSLFLQWRTSNPTLGSSNQNFDQTKFASIASHKNLMRLFLFIGLYKVAIWFLDISITEIRYASLNVLPTAITTFLNIWGTVDSILNVFAPICLILGITHLISTMTNSRFLNYISHKVNGSLSSIAISHQQVNMTRFSTLTFCILIIVTYGTLISSSMDGLDSLAIRRASLQTGGDINCILELDTPENITDIIEEIEGVNSASLQKTYTVALGGWITTVVALNFDEWLSAAYWEEYWFEFPSGDMSNPNFTNQSIILEKKLAAQLELEIGNQLTIEPIEYTNNNSLILNITGLFGPDPIYERSSSGGGYYDAEDTWSFVSFDLVSAMNVTPRMKSVVVSIIDDSQYETIVQELLKLPIVKVQNRFENNEFSSIENTIRMSYQIMIYALVAFMATVGISSLIASIISNLKKDIVYMRLRGISQTKIHILLFSEILPTMLFSAVSIFLGLLASIGINSHGLVPSSPALVEYQFGIGYIFLTLTTISLILVMLSLIIPIMKLKMDSLHLSSVHLKD